MNAALIEIADQQSWDGLAGAAGSHVLQSWGWGALKQRFGWQPLRLAARDASGAAALAQVLIRRQLGLSVLYVPRGPVWSGAEELDSLLIAGLIRLARRMRGAFLRLEPDVLEQSPEARTLHTRLLLQGFEPAEPLQPRTSIHLDLSPQSEQLLAGMSKGHRADIKRAGKQGVTVRVGTAPGDLETFFGLMQETARRASFGIHSLDYYRSAWELFGGAAAGSASRLLLAEQEGQPVAGFLVLGWGAEGQYMYSAANNAGLRSGANHLLQWEALQWARGRGCLRYDFWGIPDSLGEAALTDDEQERAQLEEAGKAHPLAGVYRFKKGFGGQVVRYLPAYDYVLIRPAYWLWQRRRGD